MKKIKQFSLTLIILCGLFFLFGPEVIPENFQPQEILNVAKDNDVIIIFNSGGWGNTPLEKAEDFAPVIEGIQETLNKWGYRSMIIPYTRTRDDFLGKIAGAKEFFNSFQNSSENLAKEIEFLVKNFPDKKIIIAGLSSGGAFVTETYEKISQDLKGSVSLYNSSRYSFLGRFYQL
jgi:pimeloyl-ACP methyl ester carboxylesterase